MYWTRDVRRDADRRRRVTQDGLDAGLDQPVGDDLGIAGRDGQHGHLQAALPDRRHHPGRVLDRQVVDSGADLGRVGVEQGGDTEAAVDEAGVVRHSPPQVADAHQGDVPDGLDLEDPLELAHEEGDVVSGALLAELAELRKVLADLRRRDAQPLAEFLGRGDLAALQAHLDQGAQVERESTNDDVWHRRFRHRNLQRAPRGRTRTRILRVGPSAKGPAGADGIIPVAGRIAYVPG